MKKTILQQNFYKEKTLKVAKNLLGKYLIRELKGEKIIGQIIETEAYCGSKDKACHAHKGRTKRTETLYHDAGIWYVYLIYGKYYCLNIITEMENYPSAVLIRSLKPIKNINTKTDGPGKLCQALQIDIKLNNVPGYNKKNGLWIEDWNEGKTHIIKQKRIGIDYAEEYKDKFWRFILK